VLNQQVFAFWHEFSLSRDKGTAAAGASTSEQNGSVLDAPAAVIDGAGERSGRPPSLCMMLTFVKALSGR